MNKKGSERDIFFIVALVFSFVIVGVIVLKFMSIFNTQMQANNDVPAIAKDVTQVMSDRLPKWFDGAFIVVYILMLLIALVLAMMVDSSPAFFPLSIIYMVFLVIISKILSVIWNRVATNPQLLTQAASLPIISFMMPKLHIFSFVVGMAIIILMVAKRSG